MRPSTNNTFKSATDGTYGTHRTNVFEVGGCQLEDRKWAARQSQVEDEYEDEQSQSTTANRQTPNAKRQTPNAMR